MGAVGRWRGTEVRAGKVIWATSSEHSVEPKELNMGIALEPEGAEMGGQSLAGRDHGAEGEGELAEVVLLILGLIQENMQQGGDHLHQGDVPGAHLPDKLSSIVGNLIREDADLSASDQGRE